MAVEPVRQQVTADGRVESCVRTPAGAWVRLRSIDDPIREAREIVDRAVDHRPVPPVAAVVGVGTAAIVSELVERFPGLRILALELFTGIPDSLVAPQRGTDDHGGFTMVATGPGFSLPMTTWPSAAVAADPLVVVQPIAAHHWPDLVERACRTARQYVYERRANEEARERLAPVYLENTLWNLPELMRAADVSALDGIADGDPVVLCGAGPSLDRLLPSLRTCRDRAWLVAIDTALRPLLAAGIVPDLVVSIDPSSLNGRHLLDLPTRVRPWLVAEMSLDPRAIRAFAGRIFACRLGAADPWPWLESAGVSVSRVRAWGSVLTSACDIVRRMRPARVAFAAIDLAYTGGQPYCRGTAFETDWEAQRVRDRLASVHDVWRSRLAKHHVEEPDVNGEPARTAPHLLAFRNWVRAFVAEEPTCKYANVTGAGILHGEHIEPSSLDRWLAEPFDASRPGARLTAVAGRSLGNGSTVDAALARAVRADEPWQTWAARVPRIDRPRITRCLEMAAREIGVRKGEGAVRGSSEWIDVPFDPSYFFSREPMSWQVAESNVGTFAYRVDGKTMVLSFKINHSTLAGEPSRELFMRLPGNYVAARGAANAVWLGSRPIKETGYATVHPGHDFIVVHRGNEEPFPLERDDFFVFGQLLLEVQ